MLKLLRQLLLSVALVPLIESGGGINEFMGWMRDVSLNENTYGKFEDIDELMCWLKRLIGSSDTPLISEISSDVIAHERKMNGFIKKFNEGLG